MAESLCSGCGLSFTGLSSFDAHHRAVKAPPHVVCLDPRPVGLQAMVRTSGGTRRVVWGLPKRGSAPWEASGDSDVAADPGSGVSGVDIRGPGRAGRVDA